MILLAEDFARRHGNWQGSAGHAHVTEQNAAASHSLDRPTTLGPRTSVWQWLLHWSTPHADDSGPTEGHWALDWNPVVKRLAINAAPSAGVIVYDLPEASTTTTLPPASATLEHELQSQVCSVAWRPTTGTALAVGGRGGVCVWGFGSGPVGAGSRQEARPRMGNLWLTHLKLPGHTWAAALSWSPCGRLLAAGLAGAAGGYVWDVATGEGYPLHAGRASLRLLSFSPCSSYLFAASEGEQFFVWEAARWAYERWRCGGGGVAAAAWLGPGGPLLLTLRQGGAPLALHFVGGPPSLTGQVTAMGLSEVLADAWGPRRVDEEGEDQERGPLAGMAIGGSDPKLLAVALRAPHPRAGAVALYCLDGVGDKALLTPPRLLRIMDTDSGATGDARLAQCQLSFAPWRGGERLAVNWEGAGALELLALPDGVGRLKHA